MIVPVCHERGVYTDRRQAGRVLAGMLRDFEGRDDVVVLGLSRGGVPVAYEVARALRAPLDVSVVRRLAMPGHPDCVMGAIAGDGVCVRDEQVVRWYRIPAGIIDDVARAEEIELDRRRCAYRCLRQSLPLDGRVVILVDDGLATGVTMTAAALAARRCGPSRIIAAVPVAAPGARRMLEYCVDVVVTGFVPQGFQTIARSYLDFRRTTDEDVSRLLATSHRHRGPVRPASARHMPPVAGLEASGVTAA